MRSNLLRTTQKLIRSQDEGVLKRHTQCLEAKYLFGILFFVFLLNTKRKDMVNFSTKKLHSQLCEWTIRLTFVNWNRDSFLTIINACFFFVDYLHSIPVGQMGNYQEYLKMMPSPLREIDPDQPKRLHTFGNPFKQDKKVLPFTSCPSISYIF